MIVPAAQNLKLIFPEFAQTPDAVVEFAIEEASQFVDDSWIVDTQTIAITYLAAHFLMIRQMTAQSATGQIVQSERMGEMSVTYANIPQLLGPVEIGDYEITPYGRKYMEYARINNPGIAVI